MSDGHSHSGAANGHDHGTHGHAHGHAHGHGHGHHHHGLVANTPRNRTALKLALALALVFLVVEVIGGIAYNSLALLGDAAHMLTDVAAYAIALFAAWAARRPPTEKRTYGYARAEIFAAFVNGATLIAASAWILVEATRRLINPEPVGSSGVMLIATLGLLANIAIVVVLMRADRSNLNIRGAVLHAVTDALSSIVVIFAGATIALTGFTRADSIASYLIAALVIWGSWRLVREALDVLLDATPVGIDATAVAEAMLAIDGVTEVHDLHVWTLGPGTPALSSHVRTHPGTVHATLIGHLQQLLAEQFSIAHTTLQLSVDRASQPLEAVDRLPLHDAVEWAADHISATHPTLSKSVIMAATGAAALECDPAGRVSPVAISVRALNMLGKGDTIAHGED